MPMKIKINKRIRDDYLTITHWIAYIFGKRFEMVTGNFSHATVVIAYREFFGYRVYTEFRVMSNNNPRKLAIHKIFGKSNTDRLLQWRV